MTLKRCQRLIVVYKLKGEGGEYGEDWDFIIRKMSEMLGNNFVFHCLKSLLKMLREIFVTDSENILEKG